MGEKKNVKKIPSRSVFAKQDVVLKTSLDFSERTFDEPRDEALVLSGEMEVGREGNPVTISIIDELTGESMEINHVSNALLVLEDKRRSSSGWLSLMIGDLDKVASIFKLLAKATMDELRRITRR
jgi:hypothetical protein